MRSAVAVLLLSLSCSFGIAAADTPAPAVAVPAPEVFSHPATAPQVVELLGPSAARLKAAAGLRGTFVQRKFLKELPQPLVSSGDFLVARGQGVAWHTRKPFDAELVLTPAALIQRSSSGKTRRIDAAQQPGLKAVSAVFDALFALDVDTLAKTFNLFGQPAGGKTGGWTLGLVPREPALAQRIARIVVDGNEQPRLITLQEPAGDRTEIEFASTTLLDALTDADRRHFAAE